MSLVPKVTQTANAEIEKRDASGGRNGRESGAVKLISHCSFYRTKGFTAGTRGSIDGEGERPGRSDEVGDVSGGLAFSRAADCEGLEGPRVQDVDRVAYVESLP